MTKSENELHVARLQLRELRETNEELAKKVEELKKESDQHMKALNEETNNKLGVQAKDQKKEIEELRAKHEELYEQLKKDKDE